MGRDADVIDTLVAAWRAARPDLDPSPLEVVGRVIVLADHLQRSVDAALARHGLTLGQFDILATLRRNGRGMTPTRLLRGVVLSSGGMTARLTRLEKLGFVTRTADPTDRRGVVVELTAKGRKVIDAATTTRFAEAAGSMPPMSAAERKELAGLLRRWLAAMTNAPPMPHHCRTEAQRHPDP
jgi:DNA-binding MarR family transcriptional regulator